MLVSCISLYFSFMPIHYSIHWMYCYYGFFNVFIMKVTLNLVRRKRKKINFAMLLSSSWYLNANLFFTAIWLHRLTMLHVRLAEFFNPPKVSLCQHISLAWHLTRSIKHGYVNLKTLQLLLISSY